METPDGVFVRLTDIDGEKEYPSLNSEGYVGELSLGKVRIEVLAPSHIKAIHVDAQKNITEKSGTEVGNLTRYSTSIQIGKDQRGIPCTKYKMGNSFRLIEFVENRFAIWEVALISQNGSFFLTTQKTYEAECLRDRGRVSCPYFEDSEHEWPDLVRCVREVFEPFVDQLPNISEYRREIPPDASSLGEGEGNALWWNFSQNYGLILTRNGVAIVHWTEAPLGERLRFLCKGETVKYISLEPQEGSIKFQARGIISRAQKSF